MQTSRSKFVMYPYLISVYGLGIGEFSIESSRGMYNGTNLL